MDKLDRLGWVASRGFKVLGHRFEVRTTSHEFAEWLDDVLVNYRVKGETPRAYSVVVAEDDGQIGKRYHLLYRGSTRIVRTLHLPTLGRMLLGELEALSLPKRRDALYVEASLISADGRRALLPSALLTYIGGLGRQVLNAGLRLPTTKTIAIEPSSGMLVPIRPTLDISEDALERLSRTLPVAGEPDRTVMTSPTSVDTVFTFVSAGHSAVSPTSRALGLLQLAGAAMNKERFGIQASLDALGKLVEGADCYQLAVTGPRETLKAVSSCLLGDVAGVPA